MISLLSALTIISAQAASLSAKEVMTKNEEARKLSDLSAQAKITTGEKEKTFSFWRKLQKDGVHNSTLTRFHTPAEVKNEGILMIENATGRNDVLMYLPNFKKIRRVEAQQQSGSFMGSVFSYSDIATPHVVDYEYKMLREEACPGEEHSKIKCYVIESKPANEDVQERTGYSKGTSWIRQDNFMSVQSEYYNLDGDLIKKLEGSELKPIDSTQQKFWFHRLKVTQMKTKETTVLEFSKVKGNSGLSDALFTQQNLQKVN